MRGAFDVLEVIHPIGWIITVSVRAVTQPWNNAGRLSAMYSIMLVAVLQQPIGKVLALYPSPLEETQGDAILYYSELRYHNMYILWCRVGRDTGTQSVAGGAYIVQGVAIGHHTTRIIRKA